MDETQTDSKGYGPTVTFYLRDAAISTITYCVADAAALTSIETAYVN